MKERTLGCAVGLLLLAVACGHRETPVTDTASSTTTTETTASAPVPPTAPSTETAPPPVPATTATAPAAVAEDRTPQPPIRRGALSAADEGPVLTAHPARLTRVPIIDAANIRMLGGLAEPGVNSITGCVKIVTIRAPAGTTSIDVKSDGGDEQKANFIPLGEDWIAVAVPTQCERQTRAFSVRFQPSGQTYYEATRRVVVTEPTGPRHAVTPP